MRCPDLIAIHRYRYIAPYYTFILLYIGSLDKVMFWLANRHRTRDKWFIDTLLHSVINIYIPIWLATLTIVTYTNLHRHTRTHKPNTHTQTKHTYTNTHTNICARTHTHTHTGQHTHTHARTRARTHT